MHPSVKSAGTPLLEKMCFMDFSNRFLLMQRWGVFLGDAGLCCISLG